MPQPDHISVLPVPDRAPLGPDIQAVYQKYLAKLGMVANVLRACSLIRSNPCAA